MGKVLAFKPKPDSPVAQWRWVNLKLGFLLKRAQAERPDAVVDVEETIRIFHKERTLFFTDLDCRQRWIRIGRIGG